VFVEKLQVEIAKRGRIFENGVSLMTVTATCHDGREIIAGVI
jgi:hypothetical protein